MMVMKKETLGDGLEVEWGGEREGRDQDMRKSDGDDDDVAIRTVDLQDCEGCLRQSPRRTCGKICPRRQPRQHLCESLREREKVGRMWGEGIWEIGWGKN